MGDVHVVASGERWAVEVDGERRDTFESRGEAITRAGQLAGEERGELVIHLQNGQVCPGDSYGNDRRRLIGLRIPWNAGTAFTRSRPR